MAYFFILGVDHPALEPVEFASGYSYLQTNESSSSGEADVLGEIRSGRPPSAV